MKRIAPPSWLECFLLFLLPPRDRETVSGDLCEEYLEVILPQLGAFGACLWYSQQVLSFVPQKAAAVLLQGPALTALCLCTVLAGGWLGIMDLLLRHSGYRSQTLIAATIVSQGLLTLGALRFHRYMSLRVLASSGCLSLVWLAGIALKAMFGGAQLEGYVLLIALALIIQAVLTLVTLLRAGKIGKSA